MTFILKDMNILVKYITFILIFFQVACGVLQDSCDLHLTVSRTLEKSGFHRELSYSFEIISNENLDKCTLCVIENIPKGLYVNRNQLEDLQRFGKIMVSVEGTDDIEKPEEQAEPQRVFLYVNLMQSNQMLIGSANLPFHIRYHKAQSGGGYVKETISSPQAFLSCNIFPCLADNKTSFQCLFEKSDVCNYTEVPYNINQKQLEVDVPVGDTNHRNLVQTFTIVVTVVGSLYVWTTVLLNKQT